MFSRVRLLGAIQYCTQMESVIYAACIYYGTPNGRVVITVESRVVAGASLSGDTDTARIGTILASKYRYTHTHTHSI